MSIRTLQIARIRNLESVSLEPSPRINIIHGANGSGKTSILEAIHFLGVTRSFRTLQFRHLLTHGRDSALVFARLAPFVDQEQLFPLGVERSLEGVVKARFDGQDLDSAELAQLLPLQVIHADTFQLLDGSPAVRRQFVDWGCFHGERRFIGLWRRFRRALKQRNSLLKCGKIDPEQIQVWNQEFVQSGELLTQLRSDYLEQLIPEFERILSGLLEGYSVSLHFSSGWDSKRSLDQVLIESLERDSRLGFTQSGPQRADIRFRVEGQNAADLLSRGQKKLVVSALKLAQGALFHRLTSRPCIYLIDDLPSELDEKHCRLFCRFLEESSDQCFITCVDPDTLITCWAPDTDLALFQIESGTLSHRMR